MERAAPSASIGRSDTLGCVHANYRSASIPPMRALAIVHQPDAGPGVFADEMRERGVELEEWMALRARDGLPA